MKPYLNLHGDSGVTAYDTEDDSITVEFKDGGMYKYTYESACPDQVEEMKKLAHEGAGLNSYINKYTRDLYEEKVRERESATSKP